MAQLQQMGFRVVLDGFDGNYMELSALGDIGTDVLKLDLCSAEMQNRTNALPGIFVQARTLRLNLLAEGIESAEQLNVLRKAGCTEGQGYFFSRPLSVDEFAKILAAPATVMETATVSSTSRSSRPAVEAATARTALRPPCS